MLSFCRADSLFVEQLLDKNLVDRKPEPFLLVNARPQSMHGLHTLVHTHSNSIILITMQAINKALKDLALQESPNYSTTVRKYGINCTTLLRQYRG